MTLHLLSPLDGRYAEMNAPLTDYFALKKQTRGRVLSESDYQSWCDSINVDDETREKLRSLSPERYIGLAVELTDRVVRSG